LAACGRSTSFDYATAIVVQSAGKIVLAGTATTKVVPTNNNIALVRYNSNGSLDTSFGKGPAAGRERVHRVGGSDGV
jgi:hypothetical protein